ncbi:MAG: hypothetical protein KatS3mg035_1047 [Bacteroidia bacterium]|nr:MAG: hypothetical protein KatS3mg035_1047 [Bacteroidia bacterium]
MTTLITFPRVKYKGFIIVDQGFYPKVYHENNPRQLLWEGQSIDDCKEWIDDLVSWLNK